MKHKSSFQCNTLGRRISIMNVSIHGRRKFTLRFLSSYTVKCGLQPREVFKLKTDWITPTRKLRIVVRHGNLSNPIKVFDSSWSEIVILIFFLIPVCAACKSVGRYEKSWAFIAAARRSLMRGSGPRRDPSIYLAWIGSSKVHTLASKTTHSSFPLLNIKFQHEDEFKQTFSRIRSRNERRHDIHHKFTFEARNYKVCCCYLAWHSNNNYA